MVVSRQLSSILYIVRSWPIELVRNLDVNGCFRCDPVIPIRRPGMINHQVENLIAVPRPLVQPCSAQNGTF
jgi:hypothetical protein